MKIGLLFGSFNPIHNGHLAIAKAGIKNANCDEVWFVIQASNPHKPQPSLVSLEDRLSMVRLAIASNPRFKAVATRASGMVEGLSSLKSHFSGHNLVILMGQDLVDSLPQWRDHSQIIKRFQIYGYQREGELNALSSDTIREYVKAGKSLSSLTPNSVQSYIKTNHLYS